MSDTTFVPGTVIASSWLNDVNTVTYAKGSTATQVLTSNGPGTLPTWTTPSSGGGGGGTASYTYVNIKEAPYLAKGDGTTDDTAVINAAIAATAAAGKTLYFPAGTYIATQITAVAKMRLLGEHDMTTTIKLKSGTNPVEGSGALVWSPSTNCDDVWLENLTFDGNSSGNTQGDTLVIKGCRTRIINCAVNNSASNAITTNFNPANAARVDGIEGLFTGITIDTSQKSGWVHYGPNDSSFENVIIIDAGVKTNNTYYGIYLDPTSGNGRFNNLHIWNRNTVTNVPVSGCYVGSGGNNFVNCHFEGSNLPLNIAGGINVFEACDYYATRGTYCINVASTAGGNLITGTAWHYSGFPLYTGILLSGPSNTINLTVSGDTFTPILFNDSSTGGNNVTITGYLNSGGSLYTGTYASNDIINILVQGAGGGTLAQGIANSGFFAYQSSAQTLTASSWNNITFPNVVFDNSQEYSTGTNAFTAKVKGMYQFSAGMFFNSTSSNIKAVSIYKNGSIAAVLQYFAAVGQCCIAGTSPPISLNAGDYVEARYYSGVSDVSIPGQQYVYFGGVRIK